MSSQRVRRLVAVVRTNVWWTGPQVVMIVLLSIVWGLWGLWTGYAAVNSFGVWLYADHHGHGRYARRQKVLKLLAIALVPSGLIGLMASGGGPSPSDNASGASDDPKIRRATSKASPPPMGQFGA